MNRRIIKGLLFVVLIFAVMFIISRFLPSRMPQLSTSNEAPQKAEEIKLHITGFDPYNRISDEKAYRLRVWGKVKNELSLSLAEIKAMPSLERGNPLDCVVGWTDEAKWRGVLIRDILDEAGLEGDGKFVVFRDDKNYSSTLSVDYINTGKPILAYEVDGEPLPREHGWPLRVVAPDKWGYKWVKWVTEMEVTDRGYEGTYESQGFSLNGNLDEPKLEADKNK
jgi:DMSO/TMAO reductase YedYZ molybdopterin-dependent catalytic subunit